MTQRVQETAYQMSDKARETAREAARRTGAALDPSGAQVRAH